MPAVLKRKNVVRPDPEERPSKKAKVSSNATDWRNDITIVSEYLKHPTSGRKYPIKVHSNDDSSDEESDEEDIVVLNEFRHFTTKMGNTTVTVFMNTPGKNEEEGSVLKGAAGISKYGDNMYNPLPTYYKPGGPRPIFIDGCNVAFGYGYGSFDPRGLVIVMDFFLQRGHKVKAFLPMSRRSGLSPREKFLLEPYENSKTLVYTPSLRVKGQLIVPYDDRYIIQCAAATGGIIVSRDRYRDLLSENPTWRKTIEKRRLMFTFVDTAVVFPEDPLGRNGPTLKEFLHYPPAGQDDSGPSSPS